MFTFRLAFEKKLVKAIDSTAISSIGRSGDLGESHPKLSLIAGFAYFLQYYPEKSQNKKIRGITISFANTLQETKTFLSI